MCTFSGFCVRQSNQRVHWCRHLGVGPLQGGPHRSGKYDEKSKYQQILFSVNISISNVTYSKINWLVVINQIQFTRHYSYFIRPHMSVMSIQTLHRRLPSIYLSKVTKQIILYINLFLDANASLMLGYDNESKGYRRH